MIPELAAAVIRICWGMIRPSSEGVPGQASWILNDTFARAIPIEALQLSHFGFSGCASELEVVFVSMPTGATAKFVFKVTVDSFFSSGFDDPQF